VTQPDRQRKQHCLAHGLARAAVCLAAFVLSAAGAGCGDDPLTADAGALDGGADGAVGPTLRGAPLLFAPTADGFGVSAVLAAGDPAAFALRVRPDGAADWAEALPPDVRASDVAQWRVTGLASGTRHQYRVVTLAAGAETVLYEGSAMTRRPPGASFSFAMVSDTHVGADPTFSNQGVPTTTSAVADRIGVAAPDFMVNLGDVLDFHQYGFNDPPPDKSIARSAYLNYRALLAGTTANAAHYEVLGGWDSEAGCDTPDEVDRSRSQRLLYVPGPDPTTYPEGGGAFENYYAFTWGDALFVMLDVFAYTPGCHLLGAYPGLADDWTLGAEQLAWLRGVLANATAKWRFIFIHHPVGGSTPDPIESAYGRGGGLAANVGEQAIVHQLMRDHGVQIFFYGHDHVFTDMTVDGIHYALPGSAGAPWMFSQEQTGYETSWPDSGWGRVDVTPDAVKVRFINLAGETLYEFAVP
jgi:3',5'-cyclic AMP phosphodiesterase CpdA